MLEMYDDLLTTEEACAAMKVGKKRATGMAVYGGFPKMP